MYITTFDVDILGDPNLRRYGREWLKNPYHVHQRLSLAFGQMKKHSTGERFSRAEEASNFLFRIDSPRVTVVSSEKPDWERAFDRARYLLADREQLPGARTFDPPLEQGQRLRFMLRANPTRKARTYSKDGQRLQIESKNGKRTVLVSDAERIDWLKRKGAASGFNILEKGDTDFYTGVRMIDEGWIHGLKTRAEEKNRKDKEERNTPAEDAPAERNRLSFRSVFFLGELVVTDPAKMRLTLGSGIGSGKAFGFGLLSIARC